MAIYELRTYTFQVGKLDQAKTLYVEKGWPALKKYQDKLVGYFVSDVGPLNQLVHLWRSRSSVRYHRHIAFGKRQVWHGWGTKQCVEANGADWDYDCKYGTGRFGPSRRLALHYGVVGRHQQEATLDLEPRCLGFGLIQ